MKTTTTTRRERLMRAIESGTMTPELERCLRDAWLACERGEPSPNEITFRKVPTDPEAMRDRAHAAGLDLAGAEHSWSYAYEIAPDEEDAVVEVEGDVRAALDELRNG